MALTAGTKTSFLEHLLFCKKKILQIQHNYNCQVQQCLSIVKEINAETSTNISCNDMIQSIINENVQMIQRLNAKYDGYITQFCKNEQIVLQFVATLQSIVAQKYNDMTNPDIDVDTSKFGLARKKYTNANCSQHARVAKDGMYQQLYKKIGKNLYICNVCNNYQTTRMGTMLTHLRRLHQKKVKLAKYKYRLGELDSMQGFKFHVLSKKIKYHRKTKRSNVIIKGYWKCQQCNKIINTKKGCSQHRRTHNKSILIRTPYQCIVCFKRFSTSPLLQRHIRIHTGEKPYQCQICQKKFRLQTACVRHVRCHTGERPYKCYYKRCNKKYVTNSQLKTHLLSHTKEKPFKCNVKGCKKAYQTKGGLKGHMHVHNGNTDRFVECH